MTLEIPLALENLFKIGTILFPSSLDNLFKQRYIRSDKS